MKKLIVICMLAAIGAVAMIEKSNAGDNVGRGGTGADSLSVGQGNEDWLLRAKRNSGINYGAVNTWNGANHWGGGRHWGGNPGPVIGFGIYSSPSYYDYGYDYGPDPYAYSYRSRPVYSANLCSSWSQRLSGLGYRNVRATDCSGASYVYRATKAGRAVKVTVGARTGNVIRVASAY